MERDSRKSSTHLYRSRKRHKGSFVERQVNIQLPWQQRVWQMQGYDVCDAEITWIQVLSTANKLAVFSLCLKRYRIVCLHV